MSFDQELNTVIEGIHKYDSFSLLTHVSPDGDTLGSAIALYLLLCSMGKTAEIICEDAVPHIYEFLPCSDKVKLPQNAEGYECSIAVDCADSERFKTAEFIFNNAKHTIAVDHHFTNMGYGKVNLILPAAAATSEIVYDIYKAMDKPIGNDEAICLYTGIVTDTGNLTYSNTTAKSIRIVAELYEKGLNITELNRLIYRNVPYQKARVQGFATANMQLEYDGRIGITTLTLAQMDMFGASNEDCEGIVDRVRDVESVMVAIFVREGRDGTYKVSLRSKECADVGAIAKRYGGGGHESAAGYTSCEPLSTTLANIVDAVKAELK